LAKLKTLSFILSFFFLLSSCTEIKIAGIDIEELRRTAGATGDSSSDSRGDFESIFDATIPFTSGGPAAATHNYTCGITKTKNVLCWGANHLGQLGDGTYNDSLDPVTVLGGEQGGDELENIIAIAAGHSHTCAVESNGAVYCWGTNNTTNGVLGIGSTVLTDSTTPVRVLKGEQNSSSDYLEGAKDIGAGFHHTCIHTVSNTIYCWGTGNVGRLGDGGNTVRSTPVQVVGGEQGGPFFENTRQISVGFREVCAVSEDDELYCWGDRNSSGSSVAGTVVSPRRTESGEQGGHAYLENVKMVATNWNETCALIHDGSVYCWGQTSTNNMGHDQNAGLVHTLPMKVLAGEQTTGSVGGYLGDIKFITAGIRNRCAITNQNEALCWGQVFSAHPTYVLAGDQGSGRFKNILSIKYSALNICAFDTNHKPYCWLYNGQGQLGLGIADGGYMQPKFLEL